ncbi:putative Malate/L-lactate dehydrogenase [Vibrio nigripulchritudo SFn27]|uniref:Putative Malate/L-lactate dehydrogenase n=1 Tax=Vibrio nigripulchritudo TaxID=28173 RepID=U4KJ37_9VIBR|nr:Ldh family oxidoreductase [Vibrio nigripulchritudo]CCN84048.1 putative Malate/L-lactate dehydrogenase [Vibrio nigripulchritudo BLFn1]CCN89282.1 putative Malate/L-lactate dehydrogenase [Vibrio nigripulchritudo SFn27]CCN93063.1 putative Malate/L-lactate dehydrogenase [Vibrio nigripulchritudo ENn2]CCO40406.1 putative Malate/L-lactate dehydrogenase [Vibrio nigripulchritudo SFn135]CCO55693.1 putative Malate/L-lactate dehydrogenase [Vibrio nigripulchritudo Wn13]
MTTIKVSPDTLHQLALQRLAEAGLTEKEASQVADVLVHADIRGVHSHGVMRVEHYCKRIAEGGMNVRPQYKIEEVSPSVAVLDSDDGMGHTALIEATELAISLAGETGIGFVPVKNTSHCGALSYFAKQVTDAGKICICMTQTDTCVAPYGGAKPFFGTNPIAFGFPVENGDPVIVDMATSATAYGKLLHAKETGNAIGLGLAIDEDGNETTDPHKAKTLLPFGGHKGFGIALAIDALTGVLMGANYSNHIVRMYDDYDKMRKLASLVIVVDPAKFGGHSFAGMMAAMVQELHEAPTAPGVDKVLAPNEPQVAYQKQCEREGIPVPSGVYDFLSQSK